MHEHHATLRSDSAPATLPDMGTGSNSAKTVFWSPPSWLCEKMSLLFHFCYIKVAKYGNGDLFAGRGHDGKATHNVSTWDLGFLGARQQFKSTRNGA